MNKAKLINFILFPNMKLLDSSGPLEVFATANRLSKDAGNEELYISNFLSNSKQPIATTRSFKVITEPLPESNVVIDTLIIH
ncbi:hypothetical protein KFQ04_22330 [Pseudomonas synxantha]|nr:hypothetical protein KFQ04_22330 [Pseudomonas synxantha]